jgi:hypothetical protein
VVKACHQFSGTGHEYWTLAEYRADRDELERLRAWIAEQLEADFASEQWPSGLTLGGK